MKKLWKRVSAVFLSFAVTASALAGGGAWPILTAAAAETALEEQGNAFDGIKDQTYQEQDSAGAITDGTYLIWVNLPATADTANFSHWMHYTNAAIGGCGSAPTSHIASPGSCGTAHEWVISSAEGGYTLKSVAAEEAGAAAYVTVDASGETPTLGFGTQEAAAVFAITPESGNDYTLKWTYTPAEGDPADYYFAWLNTGTKGFYLSTTPSTARLFAYVELQNPIASIPGYDRVTTAEALADGSYLVIAPANDGNYYVLRPDAWSSAAGHTLTDNTRQLTFDENRNVTGATGGLSLSDINYQIAYDSGTSKWRITHGDTLSFGPSSSHNLWHTKGGSCGSADEMFITHTDTNGGSFKISAAQGSGVHLVFNGSSFTGTSKNLTTVMTEFLFFREIDKTSLKQVMDEVGDLDGENYTAASWGALQTELGKAQSVYDSDAAVGADIAAAIDRLRAAIDGLVPEPQAGTATAGYSKVTLTWPGAPTWTYDIYRADSESGLNTAEKLATVSSATEYSDQVGANAGPYWYRVDIRLGGTVYQGLPFESDQATGMEALKSHASFYKDYSGVDFDGSNDAVQALTSAEFNKIKGLKQGTILVQYKYTGDMSNAVNHHILLGMGSSNPGACEGGGAYFSYGAIGNRMRFEWVGGLKSYDINLEERPIWHTAALVDGSSNMFVSVNGSKAIGYTSSQWDGFLSRVTNPTSFGVGGFVDGAPSDTTSHIGANWVGGVNYVLITDEVLTQAEANEITLQETAKVEPSLALNSMFSAAAEDATWVFTGGAAAQGRTEDIGGARSYIGEFEEYIRWTKAPNSQIGRQRHVMSTARAGQTVKDASDTFDERIAPLDPRAVVYLVSQADTNGGSAGVAAFKADLTAFLNKALALKDGSALAVVQTPYARGNDADNAVAALYAQAAKDAVAELNNARVFVVDHYEQTKAIADWGTNYLNSNGTPNAKGHLELGRQLCLALYGSTADYPTNTPAVAANYPDDLTALAAPAAYLPQLPSVTAGADSLLVTLPAETSISQWTYTLEVADSYTLTGEAALTGKSFTIDGLPAGKTYTLKLVSADGTLGLQTMTGTVADGAAATAKTAQLTAAQQALADLVAGSEPLTWLFMGDSITHGAKWLKGYDSISQSMEKFIKDDLGRVDDIVVNTANSGATSQDIVDNLTQRLTKFDPDVVSIMIGTNDASSSSTPVSTYQANLRTILTAIQNKGAVAIVRTPTPTQNTTNGRNTNVPKYQQAMLSVAKEFNNVIVVDQYTYWNDFLTEMPFLWAKLFGETSAYLHPNPNGQLIMTHQFLRDTGLWRDDSYIANLFYEIPLATRQVNGEPPVSSEDTSISMSGQALADRAGVALGHITLTALDEDGRSYTTQGKAADTLTLSNLPQGTYTVTATGCNTADGTLCTFRTKTVELGQLVQVDFDVLLDQHFPSAKLAVGDKVGGLSVSEAAPAGTYTFSLVSGEGDDDNAFFSIEGSELKVAQALTGGTTYSLRVKAEQAEGYAAERAITLTAMSEDRLFREENIPLPNDGSGVDLSEKDYAQQIFRMTEGTFIVQYTETAVGTLLGVSNKDDGKPDNHFHLYTSGSSDTKNTRTLGAEVRGADNTNSASFSYGGEPYRATTGRVRVIQDNQPKVNTVAFRADAESRTYTLFANGGMVYTWDMGDDYKFLSDIDGLNSFTLGKVIRGNVDRYNTFRGTIHYVEAYGAALTDEELLQITGATDAGQYIFQSGDGSNSNYFRIPALTTLADGKTMIAAIDARHGGTQDSSNNIDLAVARSTDGGQTWGEVTMPLHFDDVADNPQKLAAGSSARIMNSACFIDPVIVPTIQEDGSERVFLMVDAFPDAFHDNSNVFSSSGSQAGSGFKEIDGTKYLMLKKEGDSAYNYTVRDGGVIYDDASGQPTEYSVDEYYNIKQNGTYLTLSQRSYDWGGSSFNSPETGGNVRMNVMYDGALFTVFPTSYLYLIHSDDGGATWSAPVNLNGMVKTESMAFFGVGPGRGLQVKNGTYAGRIILPVYEIAGTNANQCRVIYSDDFGETWSSGAAVARPNISSMTESQVVEMPDGSLRIFGRTTSGKVAMAASLDGGETWTNAALVSELINTSGSGCQISVINYEGLIDGKPALILSSPAGSSRSDGRIRIGLIEEHSGATGADRYTINWKYEYSVNGAGEYFAYSCLSQTPTGVGILYENFNTRQPMDVVRYLDLTLDQLKGRDTVEITPQCDPEQGTVSGGGNWNVGDTAHVSAQAAEGYQFKYWQNRYGATLPSSTAADYYFTATQDMTPWAVFERVVEKTYGVSGVVEDQNGGALMGAVVTLMQGKTQVDQVYTGAGGTYQFSDVPSGDYSLVVTKDDRTVTSLVSVSNADAVQQNVTVPNGNVNSVLEVTGDDTPKIAVGNLNAAAIRAKQAYPSAGTITVTMTVEAKTQSTAENASDIKAFAGSSEKLDYLDISLALTRDGTTTSVPTTSDLMTIVIPFSFANKVAGSIKVYRYHGSEVSELPSGWDPMENAGSEGVELGSGKITLHVRNFSTYAIAYEETYTPSPSYSSGSTTAKPTVVVTTDKATGETTAAVELPRGMESAVISIPAKDIAPNVTLNSGNVLVIVDKDGGETVVKKSIVDGGTVKALLTGSCTVKIVDNSKTFTDTAGHWAADSIAFAASHELFQGTGAGKFSPGMPMDRAMLATVLYRLEDAAAQGTNPFDDVAEGTWYTDAVIWASAEKIVTGTGAGFAPARPITRQEIVTMLYRYAQAVDLSVKSSDDLKDFSDADTVASWARSAMEWGVAVELVQGKSGALLDPEATASRAEVATLMERMVKLLLE